MTAACHEADMLLLCARSALNPREAERLRTLATGVVDWELLFLLARKQRVLPLLERHLEAACPGKAPRAWNDRLRSRTAENAQRNGQLAAETARVLALADRSGIVAVAFKGPLLAATAYGDLTLRQVWDIELLVEERQSGPFIGIRERRLKSAARGGRKVQRCGCVWNLLRQVTCSKDRSVRPLVQPVVALSGHL